MLESVSIPVMCLMVFFHQGIGGEDVRNVTGYIGESVALRSAADPSWTLNTIRWSIYENFTFIAVLQGKSQNVDLFSLFSGRLELDKTSGDLIIKNIASRDALKYRVDLMGQEANQRKTSYVQLFVQERLSKPSIHVRHRFLDSGCCVISLGCLSVNSKISLSWEPEHGFREPFWSGPQGGPGESVLWTSFKPNRVVTFSCIAADDSHRESCNKSVTCTEPEPKRNNTQPGRTQVIHVRTNDRIIAAVIALIFGGTIGCLVTIFVQKYKDGYSQPSGSSGSEDLHKASGGSENTGGDNQAVDSTPSDTKVTFQDGYSQPSGSSGSEDLHKASGGSENTGGDNQAVDSTPSDTKVTFQELGSRDELLITCDGE